MSRRLLNFCSWIDVKEKSAFRARVAIRVNFSYVCSLVPHSLNLCLVYPESHLWGLVLSCINCQVIWLKVAISQKTAVILCLVCLTLSYLLLLVSCIDLTLFLLLKHTFTNKHLSSVCIFSNSISVHSSVKCLLVLLVSCWFLGPLDISITCDHYHIG